MTEDGADPFIYLLMSPDDHSRAVREGVWMPESLREEGFIHASPADQLTRVANKHYSRFDELRVVALRAVRVTAEIRWEPAARGLYPHIYGPVNMDAAECVTTVRKDIDGRFAVPPQIV
jgi:uncharacterized protein (DUF952 family)